MHRTCYKLQQKIVVNFLSLLEFGQLRRTECLHSWSCRLMETAVNRKYSTSNARIFSRKYKLCDMPVCRETFVKSLGISTKRVNTALKKKHSGSLVDRRGGQRESRKLTAEVLQKVINHIDSFPRYKSHYTRAVSMKEFFNPELSVSKM